MSLLSGLVLTAALHTQLLGNIWPEPPQPPVPPIPPIKPVLSGARDADCARDGGAGNLFGETAYMRAEAGLPDVPEDMMRALAAARIAQDAGAAGDLLAPYLGDGSTALSQVARLHLAYAVLRVAPQAVAAQAQVVRSLLKPEPAFEPYSDAHYLRAVLARAEGDRATALTAINKALEIHPQFYNAVILRALLIMRDADTAFRRHGMCQPLFDALETAIVPVAQLGACPLQLGHFRLVLDRSLPHASGARRSEVLRVVDIALAYAANKDVMHRNMLLSYDTQTPLCQTTLERYDFGLTDK